MLIFRISFIISMLPCLVHLLVYLLWFWKTVLTLSIILHWVCEGRNHKTDGSWSIWKEMWRSQSFSSGKSGNFFGWHYSLRTSLYCQIWADYEPWTENLLIIWPEVGCVVGHWLSKQLVLYLNYQMEFGNGTNKWEAGFLASHKYVSNFLLLYLLFQYELGNAY